MSVGKFVCVPLSLGLLFSSSAYALENCVTPPSCEELGFTVNVEDCDGSSLKCPWDLSKAACKKKTPKTPSLILYGDGTVTKEILTDKTPIGIVFDEENQLALALTDGRDGTEMHWSSSFCGTPNLNSCRYSNLDSCDVDGRFNTDAILASTCNGTIYAVEATYYYNPSGCTADFCKKFQWFLPSMRDLANIYVNKTSINESLKSISNSGAKALTESYYWSSTEYDDNDACRFNMSDGNRNSGGKNMFYSMSYVRPVVYYGEPKNAPILYGDGTVTNEILTNKTPVGIVFDKVKRLALALTDVDDDGDARSYGIYWSESFCDIPNLENCSYSEDLDIFCGADGRTNTDAILATNGGCSGITYAANGANLYEPSGCTTDFCKKNKWFLPSMRDWVRIDRNKAFINANLTLLSSSGATTLKEGNYWSSNENSNTYAHCFFIRQGEFGSPAASSNYKKNYYYVRPVVKY